MVDTFERGYRRIVRRRRRRCGSGGGQARGLLGTSRLREKAAALSALEARNRVLRERLNDTEEELSNSESALRDAKRALADKELQLAWITTHFREPSALADGLRFRRAVGRL